MLIGPMFARFLFLLATLAGLSAPAMDLEAPRARVAIVFGDSITAGTALPKAERDRAWPAIVERESGGAFTMVNEGKGGRPTASVAEFEQMLARQPRADVLVLALGTNDSRDITSHCVPKAVHNLRAMINLARAKYGPRLRVLLVGPPNINKDALVATKPIANEREAKLRELGDAFERLARETGSEFVSLYGSVPLKSLTKDGVHPDAAGNAAIAGTLGEKLKTIAP
jgi:acyl-CoA thioesterase I